MIEFRNAHVSGGTRPRRVDFNVVLFENGEILTQYRNIADDGRERGNSATIGIESHTGTDALRFAFEPDAARSEPTVTSVRYRPPPPPRSHTISGHVRDAENRPVVNATVTIEGTPITPAMTAPTASRSSGCPRARTPRRSPRIGCQDTRTQVLVVSGPVTLDFTLSPRSDALGYTCRLEEAAFEQRRRSFRSRATTR